MAVSVVFFLVYQNTRFCLLKDTVLVIKPHGEGLLPPHGWTIRVGCSGVSQWQKVDQSDRAYFYDQQQSASITRHRISMARKLQGQVQSFR